MSRGLSHNITLDLVSKIKPDKPKGRPDDMLAPCEAFLPKIFESFFKARIVFQGIEINRVVQRFRNSLEKKMWFIFNDIVKSEQSHNLDLAKSFGFRNLQG